MTFNEPLTTTTTQGEGMADTRKQSRSPKSDFIRAQPLDMTTTEVIKAAKKAGLIVSDKLVYGVRGEMKTASATWGEPCVRPRKPGRVQQSYDLWEAAQRAQRELAAAPKPVPVAAVPVAVPEVVLEYRRLVMRLGTARARALLDAFELEAVELDLDAVPEA